MKFKIRLGLILFFVFTAGSAHATGREGGNGGDICQQRIEAIRNNISAWIQAGNSSQLNFNGSVTTLANYNTKMESVIALTRLNDQTSISCTDDESIVQVDGAQKTCVAYPDSNQPRIVCYRGISSNGQFVGGIMGLSEDNQYFQVHHEFAVLAGLEDQAGQETDYPLSSQISGHLESIVVKQLPIEPLSGSDGADPCFAERPLDQVIADSYAKMLFSTVQNQLASSGILSPQNPQLAAIYGSLQSGEGCDHEVVSGKCPDESFLDDSDVYAEFLAKDGTQYLIDPTIDQIEYPPGTPTPVKHNSVQIGFEGFAWIKKLTDGSGTVTRCQIIAEPISYIEVMNETTKNAVFFVDFPQMSNTVLADYAASNR